MGHRTVSVVLIFGRFPERLYLNCVKSDEHLANYALSKNQLKSAKKQSETHLSSQKKIGF